MNLLHLKEQPTNICDKYSDYFSDKIQVHCLWFHEILANDRLLSWWANLLVPEFRVRGLAVHTDWT